MTQRVAIREHGQIFHFSIRKHLGVQLGTRTANLSKAGVSDKQMQDWVQVLDLFGLWHDILRLFRSTNR